MAKDTCARCSLMTTNIVGMVTIRHDVEASFFFFARGLTVILYRLLVLSLLYWALSQCFRGKQVPNDCLWNKSERAAHQYLYCVYRVIPTL